MGIFEFLFGMSVYKKANKVVKQYEKEKDEHIKAISLKEMKNKEAEQRKRELYKDKILIVEDFFKTEFDLLSELKGAVIDANEYYDKTRWKLPTYERKRMQTYEARIISSSLIRKLVKKLDFQGEFIKHLAYAVDEESSLQYLMENTEIFKIGDEYLRKYNYRMMVSIGLEVNEFSKRETRTMALKFFLIDESKY